MRLHLSHRTLYRYDVPVALGGHRLRLVPQWSGLASREHRLRLEPAPATQLLQQDEFGNEVCDVTFTGETWQLAIDSEATVDTLPPAPLPSVLALLPWRPPLEVAAEYSLFQSTPAVRQFSGGLAASARGGAVAFLDGLAQALHQVIDRGVRPTGDARSADETLQLRAGACRDVSLLFLECCRAQGIAARFVSGYQSQAETPDGQRYLHAWAEAYLPGVGWRGWDATHGLRVAEGHVALCRAPGQHGTMPVEGVYSFRGTVLNTTLDHRVDIRAG